jgi:23S rRNA A2030 N6-methylase RlmJ
MSYLHSDKAGNPGDVVKHAFLAELLARIAVASDAAATKTPFIYLETHSGPAAHLLTPGGEWEEGLGALDASEQPGVWERMVLANGPNDGLLPAAEAEGYQPYPGSSLLALTLLRERGIDPYLTLSELNDEVATELEASFRAPDLVSGEDGLDPDMSSDMYKIVVRVGDGYATLQASLAETPLPAFVLIDPPAFDAIRVQRALTACAEAKVPVLAWLPLIADRAELPPEAIGLEAWCAQTDHRSFRATWPRRGREDRCTRGCLLVGAGFSDQDWEAAREAVTSLNTPLSWSFS